MNDFVEHGVKIINFDLEHNPLDDCCWSNYINGVWNTHGSTLCLLSAAIFISVAQLPKPNENKLYWFHSFLLVLFKGFGGGCLGPMLIGKLPVIISNDMVVICCVVAWYFVHNSSIIRNIILETPIRCLWTVMACIFRTHAICSLCKLACATIKVGRPIYQIPLVSTETFSI